MLFPAENLAASRIVKTGYRYADRLSQYPEHRKLFGDNPIKIKAKSLIMADRLLSEFDAENPEFRRLVKVK